MTPPIPPNCPYFEVEAFEAHDLNRVYFVLPHGAGQWRVGFPEPERNRIIAAVARCAWLDEAERLRRLWRVKALEGNVQAADSAESNARGADKAAELWKKWGQQ